MDLYPMLFVFFLLAAFATIIKYFGGEGLIAGYNTSSPDEQKYMKDKGVGSFIGNYLYLLALVILAGYLAARAGFAWGEGVSWGLFAVIIIVMLVRAQRFNPPPELADPKSARVQKIGLIIGGMVTIIVLGSILWGSLPARYTFSSNAMQISGAYGIKLTYSSIDEIKLEPTIPAIGIKTNGLGIGPILKGHFQVDKMGSCLLFLRSASGPVIIITRQDKQEPVLINMPEPAQTRNLYQEIQSRVD